MSLYNKVVQFVNDAFKGKQIRHFERTVFWLERFLPNITDTHRIAAYSHDIERAFRDEKNKVPEEYLSPVFWKYHSETGAEIIGKFLSEQGMKDEDIQKVRHLVSKHEVGGDNEQNALKDADSVSFFETNAGKFVKEKGAYGGVEKIQGKFDWMFSRISTEERKEFARQNYNKWSRELKESK